MRMATCWGCGRRRPFKKLACGEDMILCRGGCYAAGHRYEAKVCRWILGDHDFYDRSAYRKKLAWHKRCASSTLKGAA